MRRFSEPVRRKRDGKPSKNWWSQVYDDSTRSRTWRTTGTPDREAARAWVHAARMRAALGEFAPMVEAETLTAGAAVERWLESEGPRLRPRTTEDLRSKRKAWVEAFGSKLLRELTSEDLERHLAGPGLRGLPRKPATREHERACLRWFFNWCVRRKLLREDPSLAIAAVRVPQRSIRWLEVEEETRLLEALSPAIAGIVIAAIETGLRRRALLELEWRHVDLEAGYLRIPAELMKSGNGFNPPLSPRSLEVLRAEHAKRRDATPAARVFGAVQRTRLNELFRRGCHAAGIEGLRFHDLRKTFLTRARGRGVALEVAMALSDHRSVKTVLQVYRGIPPEELLQAVGRGSVSQCGSAVQDLE